MRKLWYIAFLLLIIPGFALSAPATPSGLCINNHCPDASASQNNQTGVFPGTHLRFHPGFILSSSHNESLSSIESRWQQLFTSEGNRKYNYRPKGVYGGIRRNLSWKLFYKDENIRPANPKDHTDPAYDWTPIDSTFEINAVKNEGALVDLYIRDIANGSFHPKWLEMAPYNGVMSTGGPHGGRLSPKYYRFEGPDLRGKQTDTKYPIVEEFIHFHKALHDHLVAAGKIEQVMLIEVEETFRPKSDIQPDDWNEEDFYHGSGLRNSGITAVWAQSQIAVLIKSVTTGSQKGVDIRWLYAHNPLHGIAYPDMKLNGTNNISSANRFADPQTGKSLENLRPLAQSTENNGQRDYTYFAPNIPNPWGYSNESVPQTASHVLWALSGLPKGTAKDSKLGRTGDDPPGLMPIHHIVIDFERAWHSNSPSVEEWHEAIDTFGPPGTFAFPYLPPGYQP